MSVTRKLTRKERFQIVKDALDAREAGEHELAHRIAQKLPLHPSLAELGKKWHGVQALIDEGFDLSEAREAFGEEWFNEH